jgi:hypothetical protein
MTLAEENARSNLIKSIRVHISSEFTDQTTEASRKVDEYTQSRVVSNAALEVDGIQIERREKQGRTAYALAALQKQRGRALHTAKRARLDQEIEQGFAAAKAHEEAGRTEDALKAYLRLYPVLACREEAEVVLLALGDFPSEALQELDDQRDVGITRAAVDLAVERLAGGEPRTLDDAAAVLAFRLGQQSKLGGRALVLPFTYGETRFSSSFSRYLAQVLSQKLADVGLQPASAVRGFQPRSADHQLELAQHAEADMVITGSYLGTQDRLKVFALASVVRTRAKVAAADLELPVSLVESEGLDILPQNYQQALKDAGVFGAGELISGSLQVEIWTDRGSENVILEEGEEVTLGVRANQPCYLQLIYHLANGMRALLYNNYYLNAAMVNHAVVLPDTFYVAEPLGVEVLQEMASTESFPEVRTREWEGYQVLAEDLGQYVAQTRGLVKKQQGRRMAEARVTITTMRKR